MSYRTNIEQQNLLNQFLKEHILSELSKEQMDKLYDFADLVVETKQFGNLISAKDSEKFLSRHIADSLVPYIYIVKDASLDPWSLRFLRMTREKSGLIWVLVQAARFSRSPSRCPGCSFMRSNPATCAWSS